MKAILEFNLPDDQMEYDRANASLDMALALWGIENLLYKDYNDPQQLKDAISEVYDKYDIRLDNLID